MSYRSEVIQNNICVHWIEKDLVISSMAAEIEQLNETLSTAELKFLLKNKFSIINTRCDNHLILEYLNACIFTKNIGLISFYKVTWDIY